MVSIKTLILIVTPILYSLISSVLYRKFNIDLKLLIICPILVILLLFTKFPINKALYYSMVMIMSFNIIFSISFIIASIMYFILE